MPRTNTLSTNPSSVDRRRVRPSGVRENSWVQVPPKGRDGSSMRVTQRVAVCSVTTKVKRSPFDVSANLSGSVESSSTLTPLLQSG